ncbi:MAG: hypothetical protein H0W44_05010 [Gammaproteobacteria bacterium]|nr:hypothetical protein [Gammaproteobacteria bacterium]
MRTPKIALFSLALCLALPLAAQPEEHDQDRRMAKLTQELQLTPEQEKQVKEAYKKHFEKMKVLREALRTDLSGILSKDQMIKMDEMTKQREAKMRKTIREERKEDHKN